MSNRQYRQRRKAFTLVELLVVITIIGMLVALMVPAINAAREAARKTTCTNNQKELFTAITLYTTAKQVYPGAINPNNRNWVMVLLDQLGRADLAKLTMNGITEKTKTQIKSLICPSDFPDMESAPALSYVGNYQIFTDHSDPANAVIVSPSDIPSSVVMPLISEKVFENPEQPRLWFDVIPAQLCFDFEENGKLGNFIPSAHSGGVIVTFCDGHIEFLDNNLMFRGDGTIWQTGAQGGHGEL